MKFMNAQKYRRMNNTAIIILAAGNSSRFGSTKQLLKVNHKTLLQHAIDEATEAGADPVVVLVEQMPVKWLHQLPIRKLK